MKNVTYALVADRLAEWNPIGVPNELAKDEYLSYVPEVFRAVASGSLYEYVCTLACNFWSGVSAEELYGDPEITQLVQDIELILAKSDQKRV